MMHINQATLAALKALRASVKPESYEDEAAYEWQAHIEYVIKQVESGKMTGVEASEELGVRL